MSHVVDQMEDRVAANGSPSLILEPASEEQRAMSEWLTS